MTAAQFIFKTFMLVVFAIVVAALLKIDTREYEKSDLFLYAAVFLMTIGYVGILIAF